jgi:hypothetical protein
MTIPYSLILDLTCQARVFQVFLELLSIRSKKLILGSRFDWSLHIWRGRRSG